MENRETLPPLPPPHTHSCIPPWGPHSPATQGTSVSCVNFCETGTNLKRDGGVLQELMGAEGAVLWLSSISPGGGGHAAGPHTSAFSLSYTISRLPCSFLLPSPELFTQQLLSTEHPHRGFPLFGRCGMAGSQVSPIEDPFQ